MLQIPEHKIPIVEIKTDFDVRIFIKREDLIHPTISGNKFWKLLFNVNQYLESKPENPLLITFGGAFSNHIASVSAFGKEFGIPTIGIIRGNELENNWQDNPTLSEASKNGMQFFCFKRRLSKQRKINPKFLEQYPNSLIIPEGGSNEMAVKVSNICWEMTPKILIIFARLLEPEEQLPGFPSLQKNIKM
jgi:1-aminocyclopropane-1-carboxylate deaminase/D-cysteine desulfhydrase-like pyridoxal-dependent ACC family enzyme